MFSSRNEYLILSCGNNNRDKIFRYKRLSTGANLVHVYVEVWDKGILKFNKFSIEQ